MALAGEGGAAGRIDARRGEALVPEEHTSLVSGEEGTGQGGRMQWAREGVSEQAIP